jgi:sugar phosphate isomerase/epimerase
VHVKGEEPEQARAAGFEFGEIGLRDVVALSDAEFEQLRNRLRALPLPIRVAINFLPADLLVVGPKVDRKAQDEYLGRALARAERLGIGLVIFASGKSRHFPDGFAREQAFDQLVEFSRRAATAAQKHKLALAVEPLDAPETNTINTVAEAVKLVDEVAHPAFGVAVDYYHLTLAREPPAAILAAGKHLRHVRLANPAGRAFPMAAGEADYAGFFGALRKVGYRGGIGVEAHSTDFAHEAARSVAFLRTQAATLR